MTDEEYEFELAVSAAERRYCPRGTNMAPLHRVDRASGRCRSCEQTVESILGADGD